MSPHPSSDSGSSLVTRRHWLAAITGPAMAASLGTAASAAEPPLPGHDSVVSRGARYYNVRELGAKGDGVSLDTQAIQKAINDCARDQGGVVVIPAGEFVIGTIELKSNVTLHLCAGARLLGSGRPEDYSAGKGVPSSNGNIVLLYAVEAENVSIEGPGAIDGQGAKFYTGRGDNTGPGQNRADGYFNRPHLLVFYRCRNLSVQNVFLTASAYHCLRVLECRQVQLNGIRVHNRVNKNNDGFHLVSNQYVHIANCDVVCQDDACALFGSNRFVTVTNCTFSTRWSIFRFGGGEPGNITISNCVIYETYGCPIKMRFGAGSRAENILFSNLVMDQVTGPISIGLHSAPRPGAAANNSPRPKGIVRNIVFRGIRASVVAEGKQHEDLPFPSSFRPGETRTCIVLNGVNEDYLENITFEDVHITYEGGGTADEAARRDIPKVAGEYFELGTPPAYGLYARNVRGLTLNNMRFERAKPERRPSLVLEHAIDVSIHGLSAQGDLNASSVVRCSHSRDLLLSACRVLGEAAAFLQVEGEESSGIVVDGGDLSKAAEVTRIIQGAAKKSVRVGSS